MATPISIQGVTKSKQLSTVIIISYKNASEARFLIDFDYNEHRNSISVCVLNIICTT